MATETRPEGYPATPNLDIEEEARKPKPGGLAAFLKWAKGKGIRWCCWDDAGYRWVPIPETVVASMATEDPAGSQEIGELLDALADQDLMRCSYLESNYEEVKAELLAEGRSLRYEYFPVTGDPRFRSAGWYPNGLLIYPMLCEFFGVDIRGSDQERRAVLVWVRKGNG